MKIIEGERLKYDETAVLQVTSKNGLIGSIIQDVVTAPAEKSMRIQFRNGFLEWKANIDSSHDAIEFQVGNSEPTIEKFKRLRPDDFVGQMNHIDAILSRPDLATTSPNRLEEGIWVMKVISAAHRSHIESRTVQVEEIENPW